VPILRRGIAARADSQGDSQDKSFYVFTKWLGQGKSVDGGVKRQCRGMAEAASPRFA
jgi:hypothetical protein